MTDVRKPILIVGAGKLGPTVVSDLTENRTSLTDAVLKYLENNPNPDYSKDIIIPLNQRDSFNRHYTDEELNAHFMSNPAFVKIAKSYVEIKRGISKKGKRKQQQVIDAIDTFISKGYVTKAFIDNLTNI